MEKKPLEADTLAPDSSSRIKENEKKKRSRVKQLLADVRKQVEFWFGDVNLHKDRFLRQLIEESHDGYVDISVLTTFNLLKKLTTDVKLVARALKNSSIVQVNLEGNKVRRLHAIGERPKDVDNRTVYVELLPKDVSHAWVKRVLSKCGNVVYVSIPRYKTTRDSKGFAFVEFETEAQAEKAIETLNNPPEDAPPRPGVFPKTKNRKPILPLPVDNPKQEEHSEGEHFERKRRPSKAAVSDVEVPNATGALATGALATGALATGALATGLKRKRSQGTDGVEDQFQAKMPSKIRRTSAGMEPYEDSQSEKAGEDEEEKMQDSLVKAKRKRKKKFKEKLKTGEDVLPLRVLSKNDWLKLKQEYMALQKCCMTSLKKSVTTNKSRDGGNREQLVADNRTLQLPPPVKNERGDETAMAQGPSFTSGVIVKITHAKSLPGRKYIKDQLSEVSPVVYVDILEGDAEGHVRFKTPEHANAIIQAGPVLQEKHSWNMEVLSGDQEQRYWQKILVDRQVKLNRPREKKRGTEKLISKAEKIIMARAKEKSKHIHFQED
ncbi:la-related protein 7 [Aplochiton taeniatus]